MEHPGSPDEQAGVSTGATAEAVESRYRLLFENVPDGVYVTSPDGHLLSANPALVAMLGFASEQDLREFGLVSGLYAHPESRERLKTILDSADALHNVELELIRKDGRRITVLENAHAVRDAGGQILCYQGTLTEITQLKSAQSELLQARDAALEASRLKSRLLANISHELRTPLNAVLAMAQLLSGTRLSSEQGEYVETIQHSTTFLIEIIGEILDFSRIESGRLELQPTVFRLRDVLEDAGVMVAERANAKNLDMILDIGPDLPELVWGDAARLRQVLTNLTGNAVKFTDAGEITLTAVRDPERASHIRFEVKDTGIGISEEAQKLIFEPFHQADASAARRFGGTGLGLSISRQIVEKMGASLNFRSREHEGSQFWFSIELPPAPGCRPGPVPAPVALRGRSCFVVAPGESMNSKLSEWARRWGMSAGSCKSVTDIGDLSRYDIVLIDSRLLIGFPHTPPQGPAYFLIAPLGLRTSIPTWVRASISRPARELVALQIVLRGLFKATRPAVEGPRAGAASPEPGSARILAAEDNPVNQLVIRKLIASLGHAVEVVSSGHEALTALQSNEFDLVLMDCQMPDMDGFATTAAIRGLPAPACTVPVIAVTAHAISGDREHCLESGMDDYISKPIHLQELADVIDRWARRPAANSPLLDTKPAAALE